MRWHPVAQTHRYLQPWCRYWADDADDLDIHPGGSLRALGESDGFDRRNGEPGIGRAAVADVVGRIV